MRRIADLIVHETTIVVAILINAVALFALASTGEDTRLDSPWFWIDYVCVVYFCVEALIKIGREGFRVYWTSNWNRFDFLVVVASLPVLVSPWVDLHVISVVLLLRLGRLFRLFRLMRFIPNRDHLATGVKRALKASVGVILALVLVNVVFAIGAAMLFGKYAPQHFGDPLLSVYSIFQIFTIEGWYEIPNDIAAAAQHSGLAFAARLYFVVAVLTGGIIGLSLANAVFVDEMTMDNTEGLEAKVDRLTEEVRALRAELNPAGEMKKPT